MTEKGIKISKAMKMKWESPAFREKAKEGRNRYYDEMIKKRLANLAKEGSRKLEERRAKGEGGPKLISRINLGVAKPYLFTAAMFLKDKRYIKPRRLAKHLGILPNSAGRILHVLGWKYWGGRSAGNPTYERGAIE